MLTLKVSIFLYLNLSNAIEIYQNGNHINNISINTNCLKLEEMRIN